MKTMHNIFAIILLFVSAILYLKNDIDSAIYFLVLALYNNQFTLRDNL
jgi:hypothetical protein